MYQVDLVPELIRAGVRSFKIEGRLKGPEYVAITTKAYRDAVDEAWEMIVADEDGQEGSDGFHGPSEELRHDLRQVFARGQDENFDGLSRGFLEGTYLPSQLHLISFSSLMIFLPLF